MLLRRAGNIIKRQPSPKGRAMIRFVCPACRRAFDAPDVSAGNKFECSCGQRVEIPPASRKKTVLGEAIQPDTSQTKPPPLPVSTRESEREATRPVWVWIAASSCLAIVLVALVGATMFFAAAMQPDGRCPQCGQRVKTRNVHGVEAIIQLQRCPNCGRSWSVQAWRNHAIQHP